VGDTLKLNNKGFAISSIMYIILVLAVILISLILVTLSSRKLILDKLRNEVLTTVYDAPNISYRQTIKQLKNEVITYMTNNSLEKDSIKINEFNTSIDNKVLEKYKLSDKYLTAVKNTDSYNVYLGKTNTITNTTKLPKNTIDIIDYKIYGNSVQEGENLFHINNSNIITGYFNKNGSYTIDYNNTKSVVIECLPNTKYKVSKIASARFAIGFSSVFPDAGTIISNVVHNNNLTSLTSTSLEDSKYLVIWLYNFAADEMTLNEILKTLKVTYADIIPTPDAPIEVENVGDKTSNILSYPYGDTTNTNNGITWTDNGDGTITANGTATARTYFNLTQTWYEWNGLTEGVTYYLSGCPDGGSIDTYDISIQDSTYINMSKDYGTGTSYTADSNPVGVFITIREGVTVENLTFKPMLSLEPIEGYEPYGYKIPITTSKNLFKTIPIEQGAIADETGKLNSSTKRIRTKLIPLEAGTYVFKLENYVNKIFLRGIHIYNYETEKWEKYISYNDINATFTIEESSKIRMVFNDGNSSEIVPDDLLEENPILQLGEIIEEDITTNIYLDEPLRKIGDYADYIDLKSNKLVKNIKNVEFTGDEIWSMGDPNGTNERFIHDFGDAVASVQGFCNVSLMRADAWGLKTFVGQIDAKGKIRFYRPFYTGLITTSSSLNNWKAFLKARYNSENPVKVVYVSSTPIEESVELPKINTINVTTQISIDTSIDPSSYEFTVVEKIIEI